MNAKPKRRGRKQIHKDILRADGLTPKQADILSKLAKESGLSRAALLRHIVYTFLLTFDYSREDQGINESEVL